MPKPKRGTALFDVLSEDQADAPDTLRVPKWWARLGGSTPSVEADPVIVPRRSSTAASSDGGGSAAPDAVATPLVELDGDRIRVSLTSVTAAVVVFVGVVVLLAAFEFGRRSGDRGGFERGHAAGRESYTADAMSEIELARSQPQATHLVGSLLKDAVVPQTAVSTAVTNEPAKDGSAASWIRDFTYVVAQEFRAGHEADGNRAREFLAQHGIGAELVRSANGSTKLMTTQGYNRADPAQRRMADQLLEKVRTVGAKYFAAGGGYKLEGYLRTLKGESW